jgi:hypothetical protein
MLRLRKNQLSGSLLAMTALVLPASAHAVELNTSPLFANSGSSFYSCNVANVSTSPVTLKIQLLNSSGVVIATSGAADITLAAGIIYYIEQTTYTGFAYCRINLPSEAGSTVRANLSVFHLPTAFFYQTLALSEAR